MIAKNLIESYILQELFNERYKFDFLGTNSSNDLSYAFITDDGVRYTCVIYNEGIYHYTIVFRPDESGLMSGVSIYSRTKEGDATKIVSTIGHIIIDFFDRVSDDQVLSFRGHDDRLDKFYMTAIKRYSSKMGLKYRFQGGRIFLAKSQDLIDKYLDYVLSPRKRD